MRFKGTAALFLLFLLLGGYVYWTEFRGREGREQAEADAVKVLPVDGEEIRSIRLTYPDRTLGARRVADGWEFLDTPQFDADDGQWDTLAGNVGRIEFDEVVVSPTDDLAQFGLDAPRVRLDLELADGTTEAILFGRENPGGNFHYVKRDSGDEILLAATSWADLFEKDRAAMRDKTILGFDQDTITAIDVSGDSSLSMAESDGEWRLVEPLGWPADESRVTTLLGTIVFARAVGFVDDAPDEVTGLDDPTWRVRLASPDEPTPHELVIGRAVDAESGAVEAAAGENHYYARDVARPGTLLIDDEIPALLRRPLIDWRDKRVAIFDRDAVATIRIEHATDDTAPIQVSRADAASAWMLDSGEAADAARVSELLRMLEFEQATGIIDDPGPAGGYGLERPRTRVELMSAAGEILLDGALGSETPEGGAYWRNNEAAVVFELSADFVDILSVGREGLRETAEAASPEDAGPTIP